MYRLRALLSHRIDGSLPRAAALYVSAYGLLVGVTFFHAFLRAHADDSAAQTYSGGPLEHALFHGWPSVWLQRWTPAGDFFGPAAVVIWASLFYGPPLVCAVAMAARGPRGFGSLLALHTLVVLSGDLVYAIAPTRPPWMDLPVHRTILDFSSLAGRDANEFASVPSLHVALPMAYGLWFAAQDERRLRRVGYLLFLWTAMMLWAVVYMGEHYVVGAVAGVLLAVFAFRALRRLSLMTLRPIGRRSLELELEPLRSSSG